MGEMKRFFSLMMAVILLMCAAVPAAAEEGAEIISPSARINFRSSAQNTKNVGNNGMGGLLTDVVIVDENGKDVTSGPVEVGQKYTFKFDFEEDGENKQFVEGKLTYRFPEGLTFENVVRQPVKDSTGNIVGYYEIANNELTFTPRYTSDGRQYYDERTSDHPYSFIDVTNASLGFDFKGEFKNASEGENSSFEFGAGKTITIKVNPENKESKAEVVKTSGKAVQGGRQGIAYAIDVNVSGTNDPEGLGCAGWKQQIRSGLERAAGRRLDESIRGCQGIRRRQDGNGGGQRGLYADPKHQQRRIHGL